MPVVRHVTLGYPRNWCENNLWGQLKNVPHGELVIRFNSLFSTCANVVSFEGTDTDDTAAILLATTMSNSHCSVKRLIVRTPFLHHSQVFLQVIHC